MFVTLRLITVAGGLAIILMGLAASPAMAGALATTAHAYDVGVPTELTDLGSMRWQASQHIDADLLPFLDDEIDATADFAVFGPGGFQQFLDDESIAFADPTGGNAFVYAFQVLDVAAVDPGLGGVQNFTTGFETTDVHSAAQVVGASSGVGPIAPYADTGTSFRFSFNGTLGVGQSSKIMFYTSPNGPELDNMTLNSGLAAGNAISASPIPEPGAIVLWLICSAGIALETRRRRPLG